MNHNKPYLEQQIQALRAEQPNEDALAHTVHLVQTAPPPARSLARVWLRTAAIALPAVALAVAFLLKPQAASAADLMRIADAVRAQSTRHDRTFTRSDSGDLKLTREAWIENGKHVTAMPDRDGGLTLSGYDGRRMFIASSKGEGFIDDTEPSGMPIEDLGSYLAYPKAFILDHRSGLREGGQSVDLYSVAIGGKRFDLYVDPATSLPLRRDVLYRKGGLIERNIYDYPADIPDAKFAPPDMPLCDYPALRVELAHRLAQAGQNQVVDGVAISLKAVVVSKYMVMALWTGGAPGGYLKEGSMWVEGLPRWGEGRPEPFSLPSVEPLQRARPPVFVNGQLVLGDVAYASETISLHPPFTISVAVWAEDPSQPLVSTDGRKLGHGSKAVGRATFVIEDPIHADDPERLLWKPTGGDQVATATGG